MHIITLKFRISEFSAVSVKTYLKTKYPDKILVRVFISSLYFDTFFVEALFL
jgi:hypothetical protein